MEQDRILRAWDFPGQNSVSKGMAAKLLDEYHPEASRVFEEASEATNRNITTLCTSAPKEEIIQTKNAQIAVLTYSVACFRVLAHRFPAPDAIAGHSLGEYSALVAAESLTFRDAAILVAQRGKLLQEKAGGAMAAINRYSKDEVESFCSDTRAEIANYNSQKQFVIAGTEKSISEAVKNVPDVIMLPIGVASHCPVASAAAEEMEKILIDTTVQPPQIPFIANMTAEFENDAEKIKQLLVQQLTKTVQWLPTILKLLQGHVEEITEVGNGQILTKLTKRIIDADEKLSKIKTQTTQALLPNI